MNWIQRFLTAITTHKADPNAHHVPTAPGWTPTGDGGTKVAAADIEAAAGIPLTKLEDAVCSETEAKSFVTKEFFVPTARGLATEPTTFNGHSGQIVDALGDNAYIEFYVPHDFTAIVEAVVVRLAKATATHRLNYYTVYGASGEVSNTHSENILDVDTAETNGFIYETSIATALSSLAAGDFVGVKATGDATNVPDDVIIGVRFRYS